MTMDGYSLADLKAVMNGDGDSMWGGNGIWFILILFFLFRGGFGFGGGEGAPATSADLQRTADTNTVVNKLDGLSSGLCDGFYAQNTTMLQGFNGIGSAIADLGYKQQMCC